jgi:hypothetical protein
MAENLLLMTCTQCGEVNQLPAVHCRKCGARLDFETAEQKMKGLAAKPSVNPVALAVRWTLLGLFVLVIILLIWPGRMTRTTGEEMDRRRYVMKTELLLDALNRGVPASQQITEAEINAWLAQLVTDQPAAKGATLKDAGVRFFAGRVEAFIAVGRGPFTLTAHFYARPDDNRLVVTGAKAGHLPLPGALGRLYASTRSGLFRPFKNEGRILRNSDGLLVADGTMEVLTKTYHQAAPGATPLSGAGAMR